MAPESDVMRTKFRKLNEAEQANVDSVKSLGLELHSFLESLGGSRELSLAKTKVEESVMWGVKHLTG